MPLLTELEEPQLDRGDILRLSDNYDTGPGTGPVDLLVFDPRDDTCGLGLVVASGYKAGLILQIFPRGSMHADGGLSAEWLIANWRDWFIFTYHEGSPPLEKALVLRADNRTLPQEL
ncbi:MAG: hypothetical protein JJ911_15325 [Rhizobiaceae bacterium]|jgi:hypothetical protein|nr:hypothetical protein [Rhizobiaceae bacterium]